MLKHACNVQDNEAFGIINFEYCKETFYNDTKVPSSVVQKLFAKSPERPCVEYDCSYPSDAGLVCGIRRDGEGFRVRLFENKCQLIMFNCRSDTNFTITDLYLCDGVDLVRDTETISRRFNVKNKFFKPMFVVDASMFNFGNINESIENFFAATHLLNMPLVEVQNSMNDSGRRMILKIFGPQVVYKPFTEIPKNISEDHYHKPTLRSCYHKCPTLTSSQRSCSAWAPR
ncbi:hypothetical protein ABMA28_016708 [Loxostege sticticalis]|uniref:Uncharacterized protein n=1 Tax=Loxostege sticticalis TaxID=481309 RepID=A0ABD0T5I8_LOXSC